MWGQTSKLQCQLMQKLIYFKLVCVVITAHKTSVKHLTLQPVILWLVFIILYCYPVSSTKVL